MLAHVKLTSPKYTHLVSSTHCFLHVQFRADVFVLFMVLCVFVGLFVADEKVPKRCRSLLAQLSLNTMKSAGVCIGRPALLTTTTGQQEVCDKIKNGCVQGMDKIMFSFRTIDMNIQLYLNYNLNFSADFRFTFPVG